MHARRVPQTDAEAPMVDHSLLSLAGLFGLGILHGLGPDHLAALGTLATRGGGLRDAVGTAARFGAGHAGLLAVGALLASGLGYLVPEAFEQTAEIFGGSVVALLGFAAVVDALGFRIHTHRHEHGGDAHEHVHVHVGPRHDARAHGVHRHGATLVGAVLAISGLRGLLLLLPAATSGSLPLVMLAVLAFGTGVVASMVGAALLGGAAAWASSSAGLRVGPRWTRGIVGAASACVGCAWVIAAW